MRQGRETRSHPGASELIWREQDVWAQFCATRYAQVRGYFVAHVNSPDDADDLAQEVFAEVTAQREMPRDLDAYVCTAAKNHLARYWRKKRATCAALDAVLMRRTVDEASAGANGPDPALSEETAQKQFRDVICVAKAHLPPKSVEVVQMKFAEGWSTAQIARKTGCSVDALHKRLQRAIKTLRRVLRESSDFSDS